MHFIKKLLGIGLNLNDHEEIDPFIIHSLRSLHKLKKRSGDEDEKVAELVLMFEITV